MCVGTLLLDFWLMLWQLVTRKSLTSLVRDGAGFGFSGVTVTAGMALASTFEETDFGDSTFGPLEVGGLVSLKGLYVVTDISAENVGVGSDAPVVAVIAVRGGALSNMLSAVPRLAFALSLFL